MFERLINALGYKLVGRKDLSSQYRRYRGVIGWIYTGLFKFDRWRLMFSIFNNTAGMTLQGGALTLLMLYGSMMENDKTVVILGRQMNARDEQVFLLVLAVIGLLLALGGVMKYYGSRTSMFLSTDFARYCSMRSLTISASSPPRHPQYDDRRYPVSFFARVGGFVGLARSIRPLLAVSNPLTGLLYGLVVLFYLNPLLTLMLLLMAFPTLFGQYVVNFQAVQNEADLQEAQGHAKRSLRDEINRLSSQPALPSSELERLAEAYENGEPNTYSRFYAFRKMAGPKSTLISDISTALTAVFITAILGISALDGSIDWITFLAYLVFARLTFMSFRGILKSITGFARHYPRIRATYELLTSCTQSDQVGGQLAPADSRDELTLTTRKSRKLGDIDRIVIKPSVLTGIFCKTPISRYNASLYINSLLVADSSLKDFLVAQFDCIPADFDWDAQMLSQQLDLLVQSRGPQFVVDLIGYFSTSQVELAALESADRQLSLINTMDDRIQQRLIAAIALLNSRGSLLFIDYPVFELLRAEWPKLQEWLGGSRFYFICATELSSEFIASAEWHLAISNKRAVALMSAAWANTHHPQLDQFVEIEALALEPGSIDDDDDDD